MASPDLGASVSAVFETVVGTEPVHGLETTPDDVERWDSLMHIQLVFALEQQFGVRLPEEVLVTRLSLGGLVGEVQRARDGA